MARDLIGGSDSTLQNKTKPSLVVTLDIILQTSVRRGQKLYLLNCTKDELQY